ncbi:hypothetical protein SISSUDRAFT_634228 [Sistotremastrum suecicum HHB10207 ss-3]|uniref:Uncharacterized protein n=1 Tax=Sistotremastrum suecicum HHB10207 ss-3 TaxID=1314776 RepID=A0A166EDN1_9AGAM|nr:hypothetical protein SISSUDRAFT_634228 [Sistotremastrum suecicum HHB10207 ss-3]
MHRLQIRFTSLCTYRIHTYSSRRGLLVRNQVRDSSTLDIHELRKTSGSQLSLVSSPPSVALYRFDTLVVRVPRPVLIDSESSWTSPITRALRLITWPPAYNASTRHHIPFQVAHSAHPNRRGQIYNGRRWIHSGGLTGTLLSLSKAELINWFLVTLVDQEFVAF